MTARNQEAGVAQALVVDDKEENVYYLRALLEAVGHQVMAAPNGAVALEKAQAAPPDIVISDLLMPQMDGYALLQAWKSDPLLQGIPFIVYTATYTEPEDEKLARDLGCDEFLLKPTEPDVFLSVMNEVLERGFVTRPSHQAALARYENEPLFKLYSHTLVRKLEEKSTELERVNRVLRQDIERRERAEAALRESEERFRLLAEATTDVAWDWDIATNRYWVSAGWFPVLGHPVPAADQLGSLWQALLHPDDRVRVLDSLEQDLQSDVQIRFVKYRLRHGNGHWLHVDDRSHILRDESGRAKRVVGGLTDRTRQIRLEEQIQRTQRLESLGQLTGGVAHDFNNLLTVILGNAQLLSEEVQRDPRLITLANMILQAAEKGAELTRHLLAVARRQPLEPETLNVETVVRGMLPLLKNVLGTRIHINFDFPADLPPILVDAGQLDNALLNLAVNARDAMVEGGSFNISASAIQVDDESNELEMDSNLAPGRYVVLSVADTGAGIAADDLPHVFEPFFTTKAEGQGSGLGLAMVFGFTLQSGGHVSVESEQGQGAKFTLYLPCAQGDATTGKAASTLAQVALKARGTVMVVEDDADVRAYVESALKSAGYHVCPAQTPEQALAFLRAGQECDLLFTDILMPGMNGRELVKRARVLRPELKVLYTTGYAGHDIHASLGQADLDDDVLHKPYRREKLVAAVGLAMRG
ncbi:response regulator [Pusillimonas sp. DMV24BSW_D]|uniref:hybrid sensor histidine kinase/response regulator n=1 Tax=Neopusillimonas aestuarii TaxID=2716226 RepID=UPI00140CC707|nr:response regulator [Pusillimonas sp. DMV24BSW_D]QIM49059.1 response regulator [Pusillimonas sp. DMV24BSW_D]